MQYPTLAQLAKMTSEQRRQRLRGIDATTERKLFEAASILMADILYSNLPDGKP